MKHEVKNLEIIDSYNTILEDLKKAKKEIFRNGKRISDTQIGIEMGGVNKSTVSRWFNGELQMDAVVLQQLRRILKMETSDTKKEITPSFPIQKEEKKNNEKMQSFDIQHNTPFGNVDFKYKNILLKGVPGTGKSRLINENLIKKQLGFDSITHENILRINIHSASSNADLMQGIGISANKGQVEYSEKQGLILNHLKKAIASPFQPFVIVLEEIQENSLNELIGDLIYLIEDEKRADIQAFVNENDAQSYESIEHFFDALCAWKADLHFVEIPYLIDAKTKYRKLVVPKNLFFFCTSNYRDDKKIVEDNLLRRFELIEIYPKYDSDIIDNQEVASFLKLLNETIVTQFKDTEIHPDRFMIGHASWIKVNDEQSFCRALLKAITEFKDIREIEFSTLKPILEVVKKQLPFGLNESLLESNYKNIIEQLQAAAYGDIL